MKLLPVLSLVIFPMLGSCQGSQSADSSTPQSEVGGESCEVSEMMKRDVLIFADTSRSTETHDLSGMVLWFQRTPEGRTGRFAEATGQLGIERDMLTVSIDEVAARIAFSFLLDGDTARFVGAMSCEQLAGVWSPFSNAVDSAKVFSRVDDIRRP